MKPALPEGGRVLVGMRSRGLSIFRAGLWTRMHKQTTAAEGVACAASSPSSRPMSSHIWFFHHLSLQPPFTH